MPLLHQSSPKGLHGQALVADSGEGKAASQQSQGVAAQALIRQNLVGALYDTRIRALKSDIPSFLSVQQLSFKLETYYERSKNSDHFFNLLMQKGSSMTLS